MREALTRAYEHGYRLENLDPQDLDQLYFNDEKFVLWNAYEWNYERVLFDLQFWECLSKWLRGEKWDEWADISAQNIDSPKGRIGGYLRIPRIYMTLCVIATDRYGFLEMFLDRKFNIE